MIPTLAVLNTMSFKGNNDTYETLWDGNTAPDIHVDSKGRGANCPFALVLARAGSTFRVDSGPLAAMDGS
jgi:hypothetical protein